MEKSAMLLEYREYHADKNAYFWKIARSVQRKSTYTSITHTIAFFHIFVYSVILISAGEGPFLLKC